jgi:AraC-like DNA-binding protein
VSREAGWSIRTRLEGWYDANNILKTAISAQGAPEPQFDPTCPIDILHIAFPPGTVVCVNNCHGYLELMYIVSGKLTIQIKGKEFTSGKGDLLLVNFGHRHCISNWGATSAEGVALCFEPEILQTMPDSGEEMTGYLGPFLIQDSTICPLVEAETGIPSRVYEILHQIAAELPPDSTRARLAVRTYLRQLLLLLVNHFADRRGFRGALNPHERLSERLRPLFNYIDCHFAEKITVEQASSVINMSPSHFMGFFKRAIGRPFHFYLRAFRITKAKSLLLSTDCSVAEVGWQTGFRSASHFTSAFRAVLGATPSDYRAKESGPFSTQRSLAGEDSFTHLPHASIQQVGAQPIPHLQSPQRMPRTNSSA